MIRRKFFSTSHFSYFGRSKQVLLAGILGIAALGSCTTSRGPVNEQGWTRAEQLDWYHGNQGSRLIPEAWLMNLEDSKSTDPFFTIQRLEAFGYLAPDADDKTGLPIGFTVDRSKDTKFTRSKLRWREGQSNKEPWVGMTCAACHTTEIEIENEGQVNSVRIDGGPGMGDFQSFIEELDASAKATLSDPAKFKRFANSVLGEGVNADDLKTALETFVEWEDLIEHLNNPSIPGRTMSRYGYGRLDAVVHILNKSAASIGATDQFTAPADAPVSYPFLWNIAQHDRVQWNGSVPNKGLKLPSGEVFDVGALGRNTGEVIGVFADLEVTKKYPGLSGYNSSVNVRNLDAMETLVSRLLPPLWPSSFPKLDQNKVETGKQLFKDHKCDSCHVELPREDLKTPIKAVMTPIWNTDDSNDAVGTDHWMACNFFTYRAKTGNLKDVPIDYLSGDEKFEEIADDRQILTALVVGSLAGKKRQISATFARALFGFPRTIKSDVDSDVGLAKPEFDQKTPAKREAICRDNASNELMAYKARPLGGIWATAPYLHNGSVRSLYQLLLPPAEREKSFVVGSRKYDAVEGGYVSESGNRAFVFNVNDENGKPIPGNSNAGHDYGNVNFSTQDRLALVEYMKSL